MTNKQDLRFIKTERLIHDTYISLKKQKRATVKVSDLCSVALINKSTFYAHYETIDDLHTKVCKQSILEMLNEAPGIELAFIDTRNFVESIVNVLQKNSSLLSMLFDNDKTEQIHAVESCLLETRLITNAESEDRKMEILFAIGGAARLLILDQSSERIEKTIQLIQRVLQ